MARNNTNRVVTITEATGKPANETELKESIQTMANALNGTYGTQEWDGGIVGSTGYLIQYSMFWDAKISINVVGNVDIKFPKTVVDTIVKVYNIASVTPTLYYVANSKVLNLTGLTGKTIIEVSFVKNVKENV